VTGSFFQFALRVVPGSRAAGRAFLVVLKKIDDKKKLKALIDYLPKGIASHPTVVAFRNARLSKETSSGKDLTISCGHTGHRWNPMVLKGTSKGFIGGSEEAVISLSGELAKLGWNVTVYNNCGNKPVTHIVADHDDSGTVDHKVVTYRPCWERNPRDKQDAVILWRYPKPLDTPINAPKIFVDMHDAGLEDEFIPARLQQLTRIFVKTQFHRSLFSNVPNDKIAIIPNGIDLSLLESYPAIKKDPYLMINTSSPDRSMDVLPKLFKEVKRRVPQARLQWVYGWDLYKASCRYDDKSTMKRKLEWMKQTQREMDEAGIETLGRMTQSDVGKLYQRASVLAYPTEFAEIDCISVRKAQAALCRPVVTDFGAFAENAPFAWKVHSAKTRDSWNQPGQFHFGLEDECAQQKWVELCVEALRSGGISNHTAEVKEWSRQFDWRKIAARWNDILTT
jgi:glycosyltransferase involved in cell wall biosynthesis